MNHQHLFDFFLGQNKYQQKHVLISDDVFWFVVIVNIVVDINLRIW